MKNYDARTYGDRIAEAYDRLYAERDDSEPAAALLSELAGRGRALELGVGTGRIALPLSARGVEVHGIDASEAMLRKLREKPGGDAIRVTLDDFADFRLDARFDLIYVVFNTLFALADQEAQIRCFQRVAEHLEPGGAFLVEAFVPDPTRFVRGQHVGLTAMDADAVALDLSLHDAAKQTVSSQHLLVGESGTRLYPVFLRYAWPSELDLMGRLAGLRLRDRWSGWDGAPFTSESGSHVSVYERAPEQT